ncbi:MAG: hypothetical protein MUC88_01495 [Planctomycetes bacterium]|jgi:hypothetical protein|nr:hypothetical protein [Planctomycetota bacterium]
MRLKAHGIILLMVIAVGGGMLWLLLGRASIQEGGCRLARQKVDPSGQLVTLAVQMLQPQTAPPARVRDLPAGFDRPCYYEIKSAGRRIPVVVNLSERPRLCVDTGADGVLAQERCFTATSIRATEVNSGSWRFGPISLTPRDGSRAAEGQFYVDCYRLEKPEAVTTRPAFFRTGRLTLDGRTYRVAVVDGDCDGRFHSLLSLPLDHAWRIPESDVFAIDLDGDGKFAISLNGQSEIMPLGRLVQVADTYYALEIASDGTSLALSRTEPRFGTLAVEPNDAIMEVRLWSDAADQYLRGRQWRLPVGRYQGIYAALEKKDAAGDVWSFASDLSSAVGRLGPLDFFTIEPGRPTRIRVGPPFVVTADVHQAGGQVSISPVLIGVAGEHYQPNFQRNYRRAPDRTFRIVDEKGTVLVADKFQYG